MKGIVTENVFRKIGLQVFFSLEIEITVDAVLHWAMKR